MLEAQLAEIGRTLASARRRAEPRGLTELDSIARLEFILAVEEAFAVEFDESELQGVTSLAELAERLDKKLNSPNAAEPPVTEPLPVLSKPSRGQGGICAVFRLGFRLEVRGLEALPATGACLLCANHASHLDTLALLAAVRSRRRDLVFPAARDYFFTPRWSARLVRALLPLVPFERGGDMGGLRQNLRQLAAGAAAGRVLVLFPEGTRSADGALLPFKAGLAFFAERLGVPVVPCWIDGTQRAWPRAARFPRPGRISVRFGQALPAPAEGHGERLVEAVRSALVALQP